MTVLINGVEASDLVPVPSVNIILIPTSSKSGNFSGWNDIIKSSPTPYLLVSRNMTLIKTKDSRLERLVRQLSETSLDIAGGSARDEQGRWRMGCEQIQLRSFRLQYMASYYESMYSCLLCDVISGPFVVRTSAFNNMKLDETLEETEQLEDLFIGRSRESLKSWICPDSMFFVEKSREEALLAEGSTLFSLFTSLTNAKTYEYFCNIL